MTGPLLFVAAILMATLITGDIFVSQPASALKSKGGTCKNNHKDHTCVRSSSVASKLPTRQNDIVKQSNSDPQKNVPFECVLRASVDHCENTSLGDELT